LNFAVAENLPSHVQVLQAYVGMKLTSESTTTSEQVGVWQSAKPWNNLATWNTYDGTNAWSTPGGDTTGAMADQHPRGASGDVGSWYWWDIDSAMQGWLDGNPQAVDGVEFQATQGGSAPNTLGFATNTSASDYPYIFVYYQPRIGDYPGSHYNSQSLTDRTTLGVNVASGNMMLANNDIHLAGTNGLDLNIGRYYNDLSSDLNSSVRVGRWASGPIRISRFPPIPETRSSSPTGPAICRHTTRTPTGTGSIRREPM
jgi:hypothetical protein